MHILSGPTDTMSDVAEAVDLKQTVGDIVILSAADSDLNCLVRANSKTDRTSPSPVSYTHLTLPTICSV